MGMQTLRRLGAALALAVAGTAGAGCNSDIFDVEVALESQSYAFDFGRNQGTIPTVTCDPAAPGVCGNAPTVGVDPMTLGVPANVEIALGCDGGSRHCFAQAAARVAQPMAVQSSDLARDAISYVRFADIGYTVPSNSLTFQIPRIDIYAGPAGSQRETDPGVAVVGSTAPIQAATTIEERQHLIIDDKTPARPLIEDAIRNQKELAFIVVVTPRIEAGGAIPAGVIQVEVYPSVVVNLLD
jgi:hypothetical protein